MQAHLSLGCISKGVGFSHWKRADFDLPKGLTHRVRKGNSTSSPSNCSSDFSQILYIRFLAKTAHQTFQILLIRFIADIAWLSFQPTHLETCKNGSSDFSQILLIRFISAILLIRFIADTVHQISRKTAHQTFQYCSSDFSQILLNTAPLIDARSSLISSAILLIRFFPQILHIRFS